MQAKTQWQLGKHFYTSLNDARIERDVRKTERAMRGFAQRWRGTRKYLTDEKTLATALTEYEALGAMRTAEAPLRYAAFISALNASNTRAEALENRIVERLTKAGNELLFFELSLGSLDAKTRRRFLKSEALAPYRYQLERIFAESQFELSEPEERILSRTAMPRRGMWIDGVERAVSKLSVRWGEADVPLPSAMGRVSGLPTARRRRLHTAIMDRLGTVVGDFAQSELTALYTNKKVTDELRGFPQPYSATVMGNENDDDSVEALVDAVSSRTRISKRFYRLKQRLLKLDELTYADRAAEIGSISKTWSYAECAGYLRDVFGDIDTRYGDIFERLVQNGQVDAYPKAGKQGGAFCAGGTNQPTFVLLNHVDDMRSLTTFAHEMGHAVHTERAKTQPPRYQGYSTAVAETASTLFEQLTFERVFETLTPRQQRIALHDKIQDDISTVFRQIACFNFELAMHRHVREHGAIDLSMIQSLHNSHMKHYLGPVFQMTQQDGNFAIYWSHLRMHFYVYTYAYGQLVSRAIANRWKADRGYVRKIDRFLTAGSSKSPEDIFADIGIDVRDPQFFVEGLQEIERDIKRLEALVNTR